MTAEKRMVNWYEGNQKENTKAKGDLDDESKCELEDEGHGDEDLYPFYIYESYSIVPIRVPNSADRSGALVRG